MTLVTVYEWTDKVEVEHGPIAGVVDIDLAMRFDDLWNDERQCSHATGMRDFRQTVYLTEELGPVQHCHSEDPPEEKYVTMDRRDAFLWLVSQGYGDTARTVFVEWAAYEDAEIIALRILRAVVTEPICPDPSPSDTAEVKLHALMSSLLNEHGLTGVENLVDALARYAALGFHRMRHEGSQTSSEAVLVDQEFNQLVRNNLQPLW